MSIDKDDNDIRVDGGDGHDVWGEGIEEDGRLNDDGKNTEHSGAFYISWKLIIH
jgi:hypothetical protein